MKRLPHQQQKPYRAEVETTPTNLNISIHAHEDMDVHRIQVTYHGCTCCGKPATKYHFDTTIATNDIVEPLHIQKNEGYAISCGYDAPDTYCKARKAHVLVTTKPTGTHTR